MKRVAFALAGLLVLLASPAWATTVPLAKDLIQVSRCDPQNGGGKHSSPANYSGYVQGGNAAGVYNWNDPYGFTYVQPMVSKNGTLYIDYVNVGHKEMTLVDFALIGAYNAVAEVRDTGKFSPGAEIKHKFGVSTTVFPFVVPPKCMPTHIVFADGTKWTNPHLPPADKSLHAKKST